MKKLILGSLVAATLAASALPALARSDVYVSIGPPPPLRYEVVPAPRAGWVWAPGYWEWRHHRHVWVAGHWTRYRPGYVYAPARWVQRESRWYYSAPAWNRHDRDGDGVPNRFDRAPDNPYRY
ncbi:MAG TPA: YXWGXW repeat-containing protein [Usitatibacter sp.]|nr:YXWGXW repeat-containing protein [Usitatibacter sp.]